MTAGCPSETCLQNWLSSEGDGAADAELAAHVEVCAPCQAALERLTALGAAAPSPATTIAVVARAAGGTPRSGTFMGTSGERKDPHRSLGSSARWQVAPDGLHRLRPLLPASAPVGDAVSASGR